LVKPHAICDVELLAKGGVRSDERDYAVRKVRAQCELGHEPVLSAVVKLRLREKTTLDLPAIAEASIDLNGVAVRAHAAGQTITEAVDQLDERLSRRLRRHRKRLEDRRRSGEVNNSHRSPGYSAIPAEERQVVRHKTLALHPMTLEEAADEMEQLDHDFFLFLDADHDIDRVVYHNDLRKICVVPEVADEELPGNTRPPITAGRLVLNHLPLNDAKVLLDESDEPFVFFADPGSNRGQVVYRRFDGHYGLITPSD
jgi:ribosome-associated translation inhibitor RaiA|tara:strand:- start:7123 stop:7890 length:768 start_codon:yes stop_codon:yes gene_type:complete